VPLRKNDIKLLESPKEGCRDGEGSESTVCEEQLWSLGLFSSEQGAEGRPHGGCSSSQGVEGQH